MTLVLAHVSDLHVSRYGEHLPSLRGFWKRPVMGVRIRRRASRWSNSNRWVNSTAFRYG